MVWRIIICLLTGYAFGCISTGYIVGRMYHVDIRNYGSGNIGTTNTIRTLGKKAGAITYLGDVLKTFIPMLAFRYLIFSDLPYAELLGLYAGVGVVLGHNYPFWLHFHGGKGIAVTSAVMAAHDPFGIPAYLIVFVLSVKFTKFVSVGSLAIATFFPIWSVIRDHGKPYFLHTLIVCLIFTALAFYRHKDNLVRIKNGNENKVGQKKEVLTKADLTAAPSTSDLAEASDSEKSSNSSEISGMPDHKDGKTV